MKSLKTDEYFNRFSYQKPILIGFEVSVEHPGLESFEMIHVLAKRAKKHNIIRWKIYQNVDLSEFFIRDLQRVIPF